MKKSPKVVITCAVTGSIHTPTMSPYLPITPTEIVDAAVGAAEAGASVIHLHARDPETGKPTPDPKLFMDFLPRIKQQTNAVMNISTGGGLKMTLDERLEAAHAAKPELCSLNMGSMNFALHHIAPKYTDWKHDWEKGYLEDTKKGIVSNTFEQIERIIVEVGQAYGTKFEFECYDVSHLYTLAHFLDRKLLKPPLFVQTIFGLLGGIGADAEDMMHMRRTADRLFGDDYLWSILAAGKHQMNLCTMGAIMGGNVRVGLEDSLYIGKGALAKSNAEQVAKIKRILGELSLEIATPDEARQLLDLKGGNEVGF
ncbi:3-keto-5-aminohexanoate cleavage protein [Mesorhizobium sp. C416B]|uniref:3-keto-5-aminohexanoate cleavage protein n=1 Tax=unclassified Mesorhizobium TaxID=325217 RepID=UPI0003CF3DFA|nr:MULTISPECIES: 3-keto-5-aminohexanoate cleavage protein [unclassified Mesorhizobium]ESX49048.1 3-keto-5-aminohexanoate cleavage protein [Mesorhizobium sp. LSHC426A00]ESX56190.1 3-keto-5-aminohexanoate cleavage protein [Mesorhizobium sp. LSHC424B00]ESX73034.1 3-keto-5-aminohexanoate cleavage protein [Mesorhizobium sp. LSHC416B00]ESZ41591.1 3-keto-5-aminohexanoate cleavage protein [Mesorhizobium sp. L2C066B000]WJI61954.1 3-keto-5-aminohexanoate cleavage protein [Mesorhizobium sp. C416B]